MTQILDTIRELAQEAGATHACVIGDERLVALDYVLACCAANACGKYGACWTCPPMLGELDEMAARLREYPAGVLIQNISPLEDSWDFEGMTEASLAHNHMIRDLANLVTERFPAYALLPLGCGGCGFCERCTCPGAPCRFPEQALASLEGYGIDVKELVESCGLSYINGVNTVSFVGALLLRCPGA